MNVNHSVDLKIQSPLVKDIEEFENTKSLCLALLKTKHYQAVGEAGVFAIVETCKSLRIDPRIGLNKGMYYVRGAVEMSSRLMNALIRGKKHSITKDKKSDDNVCILHGKRSDNGDTWSVNYSIKDAERAGLLKNPTWKTTPSDMLFARALSRLARQLFPDVIGNCYVEGEISDAPPLYDNTPVQEVEDKQIVDQDVEVSPMPTITSDDVEEIESLIGEDEERKKSMLHFVKEKFKVSRLGDLTLENKDWLCDRLKKSNHKKNEDEEEL